MGTRNRYFATKISEAGFDAFGNSYPDILSFPISKFVYNEVPAVVYLTEADIERFDAFISRFYNVSDYDDLILYLNQVKNKHDLYVGQKILLPILTDIDKFYLKYIQ